jgi:hypothetical protein
MPERLLVLLLMVVASLRVIECQWPESPDGSASSPSYLSLKTRQLPEPERYVERKGNI